MTLPLSCHPFLPFLPSQLHSHTKHPPSLSLSLSHTLSLPRSVIRLHMCRPNLPIPLQLATDLPLPWAKAALTAQRRVLLFLSTDAGDGSSGGGRGAVRGAYARRCDSNMSYYLLLTTYCLLPTTYYLLLTSDHLLLITCHLLLTTYY